MTASIPASYFVQVTPQVLAAGGTGLVLNGLLLTQSTRQPIGSVLSFPSAAAVATYFGAASAEATYAAQYFVGFTNSNQQPGSILITQYPEAAVSGYLRGGSLPSLATLKLITTGTFSVTVDGTLKTSSALNLSGAASYSAAAALITTALAGPVCTYDSVSNAFIITSGTTGATSSVTVASGTNAAPLMLTTATGAVTSAGAAAAVPATFMAAVVAQTTNWATFATLWEPSDTESLLFAAWNSAQNSLYSFVLWDTDVTVIGTPGSYTGIGSQIIAASYAGVHLVYAPVNLAQAAAFVQGFAASLNFYQTNGRATLAYKSAPGLSADVTSATALANLTANGFNAYAAVATANQNFIYYYPGSITGQFTWFDSYINQIWLNSNFQLNLITLMTQVKSIPYNADGDSLIRASIMDTVNAFSNFGGLRAGVALSSLQIVEVNQAAGKTIAPTLGAQGWYVLSNAAGTAPTVRQARGSPPFSIWYVDGQSVQSLNLQSIILQ